MSNQKSIKHLSDMREAIAMLIKQYNNAAKEIDMNGRLALVSAEVWDNEQEDEKPMTWEEKAKTWDYDTSMNINRCGAGAWFPSAICR